jgi:cyclopropane-fatty-acyl-phospholipid synthase
MLDLAALCEAGWIPDPLARFGMRRLIRQRLREIHQDGPVAEEARQAAFLAGLREGPIAEATEAANAQHYEVPAAFFERVLGPELKYSCALFDPGVARLGDAEAAMLALTCQRAGLEDGMRILELGCGWGSLTLWMARHFPEAEIVALSNSASQRAHIEARAEAAGLTNLRIETANVGAWDTEARFDRIVSVEMFEHMRNYGALLGNCARWLAPRGKLFTHVFCHRSLAYPYADGDGWMERYFFTGGIMPREDLFEQFPEVMTVEQRWWVDGTHYERTSNAWLANLDAQREAVEALCHETYGPAEGTLWVQRWRMFFMACAELFGIDRGQTYGVVHSLMRPAADPAL